MFFPILVHWGLGVTCPFLFQIHKTVAQFMDQAAHSDQMTGTSLDKHSKSLYKRTQIRSADWGQKLSSIFWLLAARVKRRTVFLQEERNQNQQSFKWSCCQVFSAWRKMPFLRTSSLTKALPLKLMPRTCFSLQANFLYFTISPPILQAKQLNSLLREDTN